MKNVATAFVKAQKEFSPAIKCATNPHFKSKYADLAACVEAVMDALNNNGLGLMQFSHERADGVAIETRLIHESGEVLDCGVLFVPASKKDAQGYGSALTYARRYSLMAACGIAPEDDDGNHASKPKQAQSLPQANTPRTLSDARFNDALNAIKSDPSKKVAVSESLKSFALTEKQKSELLSC